MTDIELLKELVVRVRWTDRKGNCRFCNRCMATELHKDDCLAIQARNRGLVYDADLIASGDIKQG